MIRAFPTIQSNNNKDKQPHNKIDKWKKSEFFSHFLRDFNATEVLYLKDFVKTLPLVPGTPSKAPCQVVARAKGDDAYARGHAPLHLIWRRHRRGWVCVGFGGGGGNALREGKGVEEGVVWGREVGEGLWRGGGGSVFREGVGQSVEGREVSGEGVCWERGKWKGVLEGRGCSFVDKGDIRMCWNIECNRTWNMWWLTEQIKI